jgi:hypothetical protein
MGSSAMPSAAQLRAVTRVAENCSEMSMAPYVPRRRVGVRQRVPRDPSPRLKKACAAWGRQSARAPTRPAAHWPRKAG